MSDLSDINMDGVKPLSENQELGEGKYLVRIEDTEKKETKEKFDEAGNKLAPNFYLQVAMNVYGGPNDGQTEFARLNLWNTNEVAVRMAKSELKSIQDATGVVSSNSDHLHGKWMLLEVKKGVKDPSKLYKNYSALSEADRTACAPLMAGAPAIAPKAPSEAAKPAVAHAAASHAGAAPAAAAGGALPSWATKK